MRTVWKLLRERMMEVPAETTHTKRERVGSSEADSTLKLKRLETNNCWAGQSVLTAPYPRLFAVQLFNQLHKDVVHF